MFNISEMLFRVRPNSTVTRTGISAIRSILLDTCPLSTFETRGINSAGRTSTWETCEAARDRGAFS